MKRRLLASILSLVMILSLLPATAMANENGDTGDAYTAESNDSVEGGSGEDTTAYTLSGNCGADGSNVTWKLEQNDDDLYCVTKMTGDTTSWRFYENKPDDEEGSTTNKVQAYTLTISGEGAMANYARNTTPWGLKLAKLLKVETTDNNVSDFCSPHITQVVFTEDSNVT